MVYLHKSVFQSHGYLSTAICHVDSRWVLKVSGFSLHAFRNQDCKEQVVFVIHHHRRCHHHFLYFTFAVTTRNLYCYICSDLCSLTVERSLTIQKVAGSNLGRSASRQQPWARACFSVTKQYNLVPADGL